MPLPASPQGYRAGQHRLALALAIGTFLLIIFGALVTSNSAGLAVPDWPTSFGSLYEIPPMVAGIKYEHGHRMWAEFMGLIAVILAVRILLGARLGRVAALAVGAVASLLAVMVFAVRGPIIAAVLFGIAALTCIAFIIRAYHPTWSLQVNLGLALLATVLLQGTLGGITVLNYLPWEVSTAHAAVGQTFFCLTVLMALFTSRSWIEGKSLKQPDSKGPSLQFLSVLSIVAVYIQLILGAAFRHSGIKLLPHLISAVFVTIILLWTAFRATAFPRLRKLGALLGGVLVFQLCLGFASYLTRVRWGVDAVQPQLSMVISTVAHVATGAFLLAVCFVLAVQAFRHTRLATTAEATTDQSKREAVVA